MERLLWIDLEMTGLDVEREVIIEVAAIASDVALKEIDTYHAVVLQPKEFLDRMDDWNTQHHGQSGLTALVPNGRPPKQVEDELLAFIEKNFKERPVLAGNSISQDRIFITKYFPRLNEKLHYRMLDVTSWKIMMNATFNVKYVKQNAHRAVDDIRESMAEMAFYLKHVQPAAR